MLRAGRQRAVLAPVGHIAGVRVPAKVLDAVVAPLAVVVAAFVPFRRSTGIRLEHQPVYQLAQVTVSRAAIANPEGEYPSWYQIPCCSAPG